MLLKNKLVFITGASSGIGAACAKHFAWAGAKLLLCSRRLELLAQLAEQLKKEHGTEVHFFQLDVRDHKQVSENLSKLPEKWKAIDILINNAGLAIGLDPIQEGKIQDWDTIIDTNIKGLLYITREVLPQMIEKNAGHIFNLGSIAGHQVYPKGVVYCASKAAVKALTEGLRMDLLGTKIRVTTIDPGAVETNFSLVRFGGDSKKAASVYQGMDPLTADDIAETLIFCASRPPHVNISEMIIMPTAQAAVGMIHRKP